MVAKEKLLKWLEYYKVAPHKPGVYWFLGPKDEVLYVGKAKDLKSRLASYTQIKQLHGKTQRMVWEAVTLKFEVQESEFVALLVEAELIRLHQPQFNVLLKDDKTPLYIYITNADFPEIKLIRKKDIVRLKAFKHIKQQNLFGPFQSAYRTKEVLKIIRPIFCWCDKPGLRPQGLGVSDKPLKACFYYHIGRCSGACLGLVEKEEYSKMIELLKQFLRGKTREVLNFFKVEMNDASDDEDYERAGRYRDGIVLIEYLMRPTYRLSPDLKLPKLHESMMNEGLLFLKKQLREAYPLAKEYKLSRIEGFDVSNIMGKNAAVSMVVFTDGAPDKENYRLFNIRSIDTPNDYQMMKEAVARRQNHPEWGLPDLIVIDGGRGQLRSALSVWEWNIPVISLVKNPDRIVIPMFEDISKPSLKNIAYHFVLLPEGNPTLTLLQQIRDESHRFAKKQHTRLRNKDMVKD